MPPNKSYPAKRLVRRQMLRRHILKMACNLYIEQIERAGGNLLGNCSCGQPVGSHLHEIPPAPTPGYPVNFIELFSLNILYNCILFAYDEFNLMR